jgi:uncharacterized membrane protein required for colicin V production
MKRKLRILFEFARAVPVILFVLALLAWYETFHAE